MIGCVFQGDYLNSSLEVDELEEVTSFVLCNFFISNFVLTIKLS